MNEFADRLAGRFPLLTRICLRLDESAAFERIPQFVGLFLAGMDSSHTSPLCFVLPRRGEFASIASVLFGLQRFSARQVDLTRKYGETNFKPGDLVRVHPSRHVYCFLGFDPRHPHLITVRPPNGSERDRWSINAERFIPRLEKTTLTRPIGKMKEPIHDPDPAPLDELLGTSTFGNQGLFENELVLLDSAADFKRFCESVSIRPAGSSGDCPSLKALIPLGDLSAPDAARCSWFKKWDLRNPTGEPLVAVTSSAEALAAFCADAPARSKLIVVNGLARVRDLQSFDDISQTQRLVLFADGDDADLMQALEDRGCRFWELTARELEAGELGDAKPEGIAGRLRVLAHNRETCVIDADVCESSALDDVSVRLESLRHFVRDDEEGPVRKLVGRMWRALNDAAAIVTVLTDEERGRARAQSRDFLRDLDANRAWLKPEAEAALRGCAGALEALLTANSDPGAAKRGALERLIARDLAAGASSVVIVPSPNQAAEVDRRFKSQIRSGHVRVCTPRALKGDSTYDRLVCVGWPGGETMELLALSLAAPRITLIGYPFERRWLNQFNHRFSRRPRVRQVAAAQKAAILEGVPFVDAVQPLPPAPVDVPEPVDDIWAFEQRLRAARKGSAQTPTKASETVPARYVSFVGTTYAFLTEGHKVVVATDLLSGLGRGARQKLPERTVTGLKAGDFIIFPESGDRELIQEKADQLLGSEAASLRIRARLWKDALRACGLKPAEFLKQAVELRRPRHILTIRNWFADSSQMGPGLSDEDLSEDLELIALITDHEPLKTKLPQVIEAVKRLRGAHLSAGMRLRDVLVDRLPEVIDRIDESGSVVDLGELGSAWIVQVDSSADRPEPRGRTEVNRLLWERDIGGGLDIAF